ncbi:MAG: helix-turn-helix domain-containing protein [Massiliimalia sp.]
MFCDIFENFSPVALGFNAVRPNERDDESYGARVVECYELEFISHGTGKVIVDGKDVPACDHALHFRRPGMHVEGIGIYHSHYIEFDFNSRKDVIDELNEMPAFYMVEEYTEIEGIFHQLFQEYYEENVFQSLSYKIHVMRLFEIMINDWYYKTKNAAFSVVVAENIHQSIQYMQEHLSQSITIKELAEVAGYSLYHYTRMFKEVTAQTPVQYLTRLRVNRSKRLLVETEMSIEEVLAFCGFNSYSYFFRVFKEHCGITPYQYREKHKSYSKRQQRKQAEKG